MIWIDVLIGSNFNVQLRSSKSSYLNGHTEHLSEYPIRFMKSIIWNNNLICLSDRSKSSSLSLTFLPYMQRVIGWKVTHDKVWNVTSKL